jgi:hypothetical protein
MESTRPVQLRNTDLKLRVPLKALLHEWNVTHAAERIHLSQSTMGCKRSVVAVTADILAPVCRSHVDYRAA